MLNSDACFNAIFCLGATALCVLVTTLSYVYACDFLIEGLAGHSNSIAISLACGIVCATSIFALLKMFKYFRKFTVEAFPHLYSANASLDKFASKCASNTPMLGLTLALCLFTLGLLWQFLFTK